MSLALHDLLVCCRGLENDKATERKVITPAYKQHINTEDVLHFISLIIDKFNQ